MLSYKDITALFLLSISPTLAATIETVSVNSHKMAKPIPATVILPEAYNDDTLRFPVLYLLHGAGDTHTKWNVKTDIAKLADEHDLIVICPDGGKTSWYFDSPIDPNYQYESFVADDCVTFMDINYRTYADRSSRALCGNSMGGHGTMFLAIRHRDVFSIAVPLSGGIDIRPFPGKWDIQKRIGTIEEAPENWEQYTVINQVKDLKDGELAISIDCGKDDFFLNVNRALHTYLLGANIAHEYIEMPGNHSWDYWNAAIKRQMPFIKKHFNKAK